MRKYVDIVIPATSGDVAIDLVLDSLVDQSQYISTVYLIVSGQGSALPPHVSFTKESLSPYFIKKEQVFKGIPVITLFFSCRLYPGAARNVGIIFSNADYTGFLDVNTKPGRNWLSSFDLLNNKRSSTLSMIGSTNYLYSNYIQKIIIAATYGFLPLITLPGSILSRQSLDSVGFFAPKWRAGEDVDFLVRLNSLFSNNLFSNVPNSYVLRSSNLFYYFFKWLRNYSDSVPYQKLTAQSHALILLFAIFILLFSFNWNWVVAGWNESFPLYVAHITKYTFAVCVLAYIFLRGVYLPIKKLLFAWAMYPH